MSENAPDVNIEINNGDDQAQDAAPVANQGQNAGQDESNLSNTPTDVPVESGQEGDDGQGSRNSE
jgi:hypothetical protein